MRPDDAFFREDFENDCIIYFPRRETYSIIRKKREPENSDSNPINLSNRINFHYDPFRVYLFEWTLFRAVN